MQFTTDKEYKKLLNALRHHRENNVLAVVIVDDWELENQIIGSLLSDLEDDFELRSWTVDSIQPSVAMYLWQEPFETEKPAILIVEGWLNLPPEERDWAIARLNQDRDVLRHRGCSYVFLVPPDIAAHMGMKAGDFWSCISGPYEFSADIAAAERHKREKLQQYYFHYLIQREGQMDFEGLLFLNELVSLPLPELFVPPRVRYESKPLLADVETGKTELLDFRKLLLGKKRVVILGDPGTGKTTILRYLALALAGGQEEVLRRLNIDVESSQVWFPLLFPISAYARALREDPDLALADYLPLYFKGRGQGGLGDLFHYELERGNCLVLLDGLDEIISAGERWGVVERIRDFIVRFPKNRFIVTSRPASYRQAPLEKDFATITLVPFTKAEIRSFVTKWFRIFELHDFNREGGVADDLLRIIFRNPGVSELARNPLLLAILVLLYYYRGAHLPHHRVELYKECIKALVETWDWARSISDRPVTPEELQFDRRYVTSVLGPLALWMHSEPGDTAPRSELERRISKWLQEREGLSTIRSQERARTFIDIVSQQSGLLVERGIEEYGFPHRTFEEFLAAEYISWQSNVQELVLERMTNSRWNEVIRLTAGLLRDVRLENLLKSMLKSVKSGPKSERGSQHILIGECLRDAGRGAVRIHIREQILDGLILTTTNPDEEFEIRRRTGTVLGELGDPRLGEIVEIPSGELEMGLSPAEIESIVRRAGDTPPLRRMLSLSTPQTKVRIDAFAMDVYPVTNAQFQVFMRHQGYNSEDYWSEEGWEWRLKTTPKPSYWDDDELGIRNPNHPVVGVSWYEAEAFCRWRSAYLSEESGRQQTYRLPTEAEWEWAARSEKGYWWPWGMKWEEDHANAGRYLYSTTPVGIYPAGVSPFGVQDMIGNVLEWTASPFLYANGTHQATKDRIVRGGSFNDSRWSAMCTTRQALKCNQRHGATGFRCVLIRGDAPQP